MIMSDHLRTEEILPDILNGQVEMLLVSAAVTPASEAAGHYFSGKRSSLYHILYTSGLTSRRLNPEQDRQLLHHGIGVTTLCKTRAVENPEELEPIDYAIGSIIRKVFECRPEVVCFLGLTVFSQFFDRTGDYGLQREQVSGVPVFVVPDIGNVNETNGEAVLPHYRELQAFLDSNQS